MYTNTFSGSGNTLSSSSTTDKTSTSQQSSLTSSNSGTTISAENVIQTNSRMFISKEMRDMLYFFIDEIKGTAKRAMYMQIYDQNEDGIVDHADIADEAKSIDWNNISNKPSSTSSEIDLTVENNHTHSNKSILDLIGVDDSDNLTYNGHSFIFPKTVMLNTIYDLDRDGTIDKSLYAEHTTWSGIRNKPMTFTPSTHTHNIDQITGDIDADTFNNHTIDYFLTTDSEISVEQITDLDKISVVVPEVDGGNASSTYTDSDYTQILIRRDTLDNLISINPTLSLCEQIYETTNFRYKIGNGVLPWNGLPFSYNIPSSIRFETIAKDFSSNYYNYESETEPDIKLYTTPLSNDSNKVLYNGAVKGYNNRIFAIPYNAESVLYCTNDMTVCDTFGEISNDTGAGWFNGVCYNNIIYCCPYNSESILKIDTVNLEVSEIEVNGISTNSAKYVDCIVAPNNKIYFAPHNTDSILEFDPSTEEANFYSNSVFSTSSNCCKIIYNPVDDKLYFIPKNISNIIQFDYRTKEMTTIANTKDSGVDKYSTAVLAPNGLIYMIPGYGYTNIGIFDPNLYTLKYIPFSTISYEFFNDAIIGPNSHIYLIPSGSGCTGFISFNTLNNTYETFCSVSSSKDRWSGGILTTDGRIVCMPYVSVQLFEIDLNTTSDIPSEVLSMFNN